VVVYEFLGGRGGGLSVVVVEHCCFGKRSLDVLPNLDCKCWNMDSSTSWNNFPYTLPVLFKTPNLLVDMHHFHELAHIFYNWFLQIDMQLHKLPTFLL